MKSNTDGSDVERPAANGSLGRRVASSLVLAPAAMAATYVGGPVFAALIAFAATLMAYEWARMVDRSAFTPLFYALAVCGAGAFYCAADGRYSLAFMFCGVGAIAGAFCAHAGARRYAWGGFGAIYILAPCVALIWLREFVENGRALTFTLFFIVWMADIGAYFAGRFVGGPRISRALSPEKTWSGVVGGIILGGLAGAAATKWIYGEGSFFAFAAIGASLGLTSVLGDLAESAFKRVFGVKDSSALIPGHGGVLDRLDGMIFATTAMTAALFAHMLIAKL